MSRTQQGPFAPGNDCNAVVAMTSGCNYSGLAEPKGLGLRFNLVNIRGDTVLAALQFIDRQTRMLQHGQWGLQVAGGGFVEGLCATWAGTFSFDTSLAI